MSINTNLINDHVEEYCVIAPNFKQETLEGKRCIMPISVPLYPYTKSWLGDNEKEWTKKLQAILVFVSNAKVKLIHILVTDLLQKFSLVHATGCGEAQAAQKIAERTTNFVMFLEKWLNIYLKNTSIKYQVLRGQDIIANKNYANYLALVEDIYKEHNDLQVAINTTALSYIKITQLCNTSPQYIAQAMTNNICCIKEGIVSLLICKYDFLISPVTPTAAIIKAQEIFVKAHPDIPAILSITVTEKSFIFNKDILNGDQDVAMLLPGNIYFKDINGYYLWCNKHFAKVLNLTDPKQVIGKNDHDFLEEHLAEKIVHNDKQVIESGMPLYIEEIGVDIKGEVTPYLTTKIPMRNTKGNIVGLLGVSMDITEYKKAEQLHIEKEAQEAVKKISQVLRILSSNIAHELKTPLAVIGVNADMLKNTFKKVVMSGNQQQLKKDMHKYLADIKHSVSNADCIISMLLIKLRNTFNDKAQYEREEFVTLSIKKSVANAIQNYPYRGQERDLLVWDASAEADFTYLGDKLLTQHVLFNLIKNACYAIREAGRGKIYLKLKTGAKYNYLYFKDTGCGIAKDKLQSLFQAFTDDNITISGTGLGSAFCRATMQAYGGDITCESQPGKYTEFTLKFPIYKNKNGGE